MLYIGRRELREPLENRAAAAAAACCWRREAEKLEGLIGVVVVDEEGVGEREWQCRETGERERDLDDDDDDEERRDFDDEEEDDERLGAPFALCVFGEGDRTTSAFVRSGRGAGRSVLIESVLRLCKEQILE